MDKKVLYVITRAGGWDGCAMQTELWIKILLEKGYDVTLLTGEFEEETTDFAPYDKIKIIKNPTLSMASQSKLYKEGFEDKYKRKKWINEFIIHKNKIKQEISETFASHDIIILHNVSLRYLIPGLWAAIHELSNEYPDKKIISIEPDSPYERRYLLNKYNVEVLYMLHHPSLWYGKEITEINKALNNIKKIGIRMLPGPVHLENTRHVVLNSYQYNAHRDIFGIPETHLRKIPDLGNFKEKEPIYPDQKFFDFLKDSQITCPKETITPEDLFLLSPVRPVYRKNIRYLVKVACQLKKYIKETKNLDPHIFLIITHVNKDDTDYFEKIIALAKQLDVSIVYLGGTLKLRRIGKDIDYTYEEFLSRISSLKSICFSGSAFGGWENAVVECTEAKIPVFVNPKIPAFGDMIRMGYIYHIMPFIKMPKIEDIPLKKVWEQNYSFELLLEDLYNFFYDSSMRKKIADHNFQIGKKRQSIKHLSKNHILPLLNGEEKE